MPIRTQCNPCSISLNLQGAGAVGQKFVTAQDKGKIEIVFKVVANKRYYPRRLRHIQAVQETLAQV